MEKTTKGKNYGYPEISEPSIRNTERCEHQRQLPKKYSKLSTVEAVETAQQRLTATHLKRYNRETRRISDGNIRKKELEKLEKYQGLNEELEKM